MFPGVIATAAAILLLFVEAGPARSQSHRPFAVKTPDGTNISAQEWGNPNGREIVFIHGFMQSHLSWSKQIRDPGLAKQFRMISYDFRGHGGSDKIMDSNLYGNGEAYAEELNAVIAAASLRRPVLVGWSYGTRIISDYLVRYGSERIAGINFVGAVGNNDPTLFGSAMPLIPKTATEDLAQSIEATKAFIRGCFEKQPTAEEFETILAFNMVVTCVQHGRAGENPRQGRALYPNSTPRVGLRQGLPAPRSPWCRTSALAPSLKLAPSPWQYRRQTAHQQTRPNNRLRLHS